MKLIDGTKYLYILALVSELKKKLKVTDDDEKTRL